MFYTYLIPILFKFSHILLLRCVVIFFINYRQLHYRNASGMVDGIRNLYINDNRRKKRLKLSKFYRHRRLKLRINIIKVEKVIFTCLKFKCLVRITNILSMVNPEDILRIPHSASI
jgi:hypothetical protein